MLLHHLGVLLQLVHRAEQHRVHRLTRVLDGEAHGFSLLYRQGGRREAHLVAHVHIHGSRGLFRIAFAAERAFPGRDLFLRLLSALGRLVRLSGECSQQNGCEDESGHVLSWCSSRARRSLSAFVTTDTELIAIAAPAKMAESSTPSAGYSTPAAIG